MRKATGGGADAPDRGPVGPVLHFRGLESGDVLLAALMAVCSGQPAPEVSTADGQAGHRLAASMSNWDIHLYDMRLPRGGTATYRADGIEYSVDTSYDDDLRVAFASCNGQEHGDLDRDMRERNAMWARLGEEHRAAPFQILLHGGDQIYADEATHAHPLSAGWPRDLPEVVDEDALEDLRASLADAFAARYLQLYAQPEFAYLAARVPSLAMWDDHDICDGWGSLKPPALDSSIGRTLFAVARRAFLLFQMAATSDRLPIICDDPSGRSLGWQVALPGLRIIAPDLRSERRPDRVMGTNGWEAFRAALAAPAEPRTLILSSVPAIGPRLSLVESWMQRTPWFEKYEDDLRDQWQSHAHRTEWQDFLSASIALHWRGSEITFLSGEIHLATRGTMATASGPIHQLVASGIAHPPPHWTYGAVLGLLARFGEAPLKDHPLRLHPLPGRRSVYTAERNYLVLERTQDAWTASWRLEDSGPTDPMPI
ncbi:MAG: alkaline phosphatase family protein [Rhodobacteraceae bacterium]|nr:alkaline phosphatase family protein [Paracoccaceae bacterium]